MTVETVGAGVKLKRRSRPLRRILVGATAAIALSALAPAAAEAASGDHYYNIYSTKTRCNIVGASLSLGGYWKSWKCVGFYSAGQGGYALYLYR